MMSTKLPNEEREVDPQAAANVQRILHPESDAPAPEQPQPEKRTRAQRSDKGEPRIFIDAPGVRFDLMHIEGRASFEYWLARVYHEGGAVFGNAAVKQLLSHIDRLSQRKAE